MSVSRPVLWQVFYPHVCEIGLFQLSISAAVECQTIKFNPTWSSGRIPLLSRGETEVQFLELELLFCWPVLSVGGGFLAIDVQKNIRYKHIRVGQVFCHEVCSSR